MDILIIKGKEKAFAIFLNATNRIYKIKYTPRGALFQITAPTFTTDKTQIILMSEALNNL